MIMSYKEFSESSLFYQYSFELRNCLQVLHRNGIILDLSKVEFVCVDPSDCYFAISVPSFSSVDDVIFSECCPFFWIMFGLNGSNELELRIYGK